MADDQPLESGYGPLAPPGDNLCNDFQQETARSYAELALARGDRLERVEGVITMTDATIPLPFWNRAALEQPITDASEVLSTLQRFYGRAGGHPFLLDSAWPTPDLRDAGFILMGHPPLMLRRADVELQAPPPELRIVEVRDATGARDLERTLADGYPAPQLQPFKDVVLFVPDTFNATNWRHFVGYIGDRPVAAGSCYIGDRLLRVENIATLADVRGKGYGLAITAATVRADLTKPAVLVSSDLGRPIYERLGFDALQRVSYWLGMRN